MHNDFKPQADTLSRRSRRRLRLEAEAKKHPLLGRAYDPYVVNEIPIGNTGAADTTRAPSPALWRDCPWAKMRTEPMRYGVAIEDDFAPMSQLSVNQVSSALGVGSFGQWASWFGSATLTVKDGLEEGGAAKFDTSTTDANKSITLASNAGVFRFVGASTAFNLNPGRFWMEFRIALGSVAASQQGVFIGLADNTGSQINSSDITIQASGGNTLTTTKNIFGFFNRTTTGPADWSFVYQPAGGPAVYPTGLTTLVNTVTGANMTAYAASTDKGHGTNFVKIGMFYDPSSALPSQQAPSSCPSGQTAGTLYRPVMKFFVNGLAAPAFMNAALLQAATFPLTSLYSPVINYMNIASATAPVYLDWVRFAQEASF